MYTVSGGDVVTCVEVLGRFHKGVLLLDEARSHLQFAAPSYNLSGAGGSAAGALLGGPVRPWSILDDSGWIL